MDTPLGRPTAGPLIIHDGHPYACVTYAGLSMFDWTSSPAFARAASSAWLIAAHVLEAEHDRAFIAAAVHPAYPNSVCDDCASPIPAGYDCPRCAPMTAVRVLPTLGGER
ncbi:hypothetical protein HNP84_000204 [Thermocatellispora tengchongensis]|uniref:Uncharacterized protein n=1 Tax=Thermocatellispora tengchongensis TaxID=1073253 RepID=A0A840NWF9_9ACTN|nr:hypothetical protein [Thermocatellispora tengchongensis]MBB5130516.1 hypothetical protein [Thermocatellispora tengchongensis]